jgi:hypothetical protein
MLLKDPEPVIALPERRWDVGSCVTLVLVVVHLLRRDVLSSNPYSLNVPPSAAPRPKCRPRCNPAR